MLFLGILGESVTMAAAAVVRYLRFDLHKVIADMIHDCIRTLQ